MSHATAAAGSMTGSGQFGYPPGSQVEHLAQRVELIAPKTTLIKTGPVKCRERLGGVLKFYYHEAA